MAKNSKQIPLNQGEAKAAHSLPILYSTWSSSKSNKTKEEFKGIQIGKEEVKVLLLVDDMIEYTYEYVFYSKYCTEKYSTEKY